MNITQLVQKAFHNYLTSLTLDEVDEDNIYRGIERLDPSGQYSLMVKELPCVIVECNRAVESVHATGNWTAIVTIKCRSQADDTDEDTHHDFASEIFSNIWQSSIKTDINSAQSGFTAFQVRAKEQGYDIVGRAWESYLTLEVECCASDQ